MIIIGVPVPKDYQIDVRTAAYCSQEAKNPNTRWGYVASRDAGVGRSTFVDVALKNPEITHLYFMDYDVVPPVGSLERLVNHHKPIIAGVYPMLSEEKMWSFKLNGEWHKGSLPEEVTKVECLAGSTLLVARDVLERLTPPCFKIVYRDIDSAGKCYDEGEDEYFSRIAREAGYDLYIDPEIVCEHFNYGRI